MILCCHPSFPEFCALVTSSLDQDSGPWVVSTKLVILASRSHVHGVVTSSCVHYSVWLNQTYFLVTDIIWIFYRYLAEPNYLSKCENFSYFVIWERSARLGHGPFFLLTELVKPVLPGEGRWLTGDAFARASEEIGVQSDLVRTLQATFQQSKSLFLGSEDCMLSFSSLFSPSLMYSSSVEELVLLKEAHKRDINSTGKIPIFVLDSKIVAEADVFAESVEDMFPSFKCMVPCNGLHTQWQGKAFKKYI